MTCLALSWPCSYCWCVQAGMLERAVTTPLQVLPTSQCFDFHSYTRESQDTPCSWHFGYVRFHTERQWLLQHFEGTRSACESNPMKPGVTIRSSVTTTPPTSPWAQQQVRTGQFMACGESKPRSASGYSSTSRVLARPVRAIP